MGQDDLGSREGFRARFAYDRGLKRLRPREHYLRLFPACAEEIAAEFASLEAEAAAPASVAPSPEPVPEAGPQADVRMVGPYRLLHEIGRGGQAAVFLADDTRLARKVALKVFAPGLMPSEQFFARFRREAEAAARLDHPGICTVFDAGIDRETPYIAMRYVEGRTLAEWIDASREAAGGARRTSSLELPKPAGDSQSEKQTVVMRVVALAEKAARALHAAHEAGLVHRDVKPGNIMVTKEGEPVLLDFGLAREDDQGQTLTMTGALLGTPAYMSPEQLLAQRIRLDCRTDVYSLGVTLYECLTLRRPFDAPTREGLYAQILSSDADSPRRLNPQVPQDLVVVLETAMAKDRDRRYRTAQEFAEDLRRVREHEPIRARPTPPIVRLGRWTQRHPAVATAIGSVFTLLVLGQVSTSYFLHRSRDEQAATQKALDERSQALAAANAATRRAELETAAKSQAQTAETKALRHAMSLKLVGASIAVMPLQGMRGLLLAREAVKTEASAATMDQLRRAIFESRERAVLLGHSDFVVAAAFSPKGDRIVTASRDATARLWDLSGRVISVLGGHASQLTKASYSPSGDRIATASADGTARLWDASGGLLAVLGGHEGPVLGVVFSPDGTRILTCSDDATARLWNVTGAPLAVLRGHAARVRAASFSPKGDRIVTASDDGTARLFDLAGTQLAVLRGHEREVWSASFSPGGDRIVTGSDDATARLWDGDGRPLRVLRGHAALVGFAEFSPQGDRVLTGSWDGTVRIWDLEGRQIASMWCVRPPCSARFSPKGDRIVTSSYDGNARIWEPSGRQLAVLGGHADLVGSAVFSPDGERILTTSNDHTARLWDANRSECAALMGHEDIVRTAAWSPRGDRIVTASDDKTARVWNADGHELAVLTGHEGRVYSAEFSPDGDRIVTGSSDRTARVWEADGKPLSVVRGHESPVHSARFSPRGDRIVTTSNNEQSRERDTDERSPRLWDLAGNELARLCGHEALITSALFSPRGDRILTASWDGTARCWDLSGKQLALMKGGDDFLLAASFAPGGDRIVTGSQDSTVKLWDTSGKELRRLMGSRCGNSSVSFSPDGQRVLATTWDGSSRVWDLDGNPVAVLASHDDAVCTGRFSPQGDRIVTCSLDRTARIWDLAGTEVAVLRGHGDGVNSAEFSPDGRRVVTASSDGTALVWFVRDEDVLALAAARTTRDFTRAEREKYADILGEDNARVLAGWRATEYLDGLPRDTVLVSELVERVKADPSPSDETRAAALRVLAERKDDPNEINRVTWEVVKTPGRTADEYRLAVRRLELAAALAPHDGALVNTLGVAQYRAGEFEKARATLEQSDAINAKAKPPGIVEDVAFLAMCDHRLGRPADAHGCMERLRKLMQIPERAQAPGCAEIAKEAERLAGSD